MAKNQSTTDLKDQILRLLQQQGPMDRHQIAAHPSILRDTDEDLEEIGQVITTLIEEKWCQHRPDPGEKEVPLIDQPVGLHSHWARLGHI